MNGKIKSAIICGLCTVFGFVAGIVFEKRREKSTNETLGDEAEAGYSETESGVDRTFVEESELEPSVDEIQAITDYINNTMSYEEVTDEQKEIDSLDDIIPDPIVVNTDEEGHQEVLDFSATNEFTKLGPRFISHSEYSDTIPNYSKIELEYFIRGNVFYFRNDTSQWISEKLAGELIGADNISALKDSKSKTDNFYWVRNDQHSMDFEIFVDRLTVPNVRI